MLLIRRPDISVKKLVQFKSVVSLRSISNMSIKEKQTQDLMFIDFLTIYAMIHDFFFRIDYLHIVNTSYVTNS